MFKQISKSAHDNLSKVAYIYEEQNVSICKTYQEINEESKQISHLISALPSGIAVAVQIGKKCCLLPVLYSLLEYKVAFVLLDDYINIDNFLLKNVVFFAIITCKSHTKNSNSLLKDKFNNIFIQHTKAGCSYEMKTFRINSLEDKERSISYREICYIITTSGTLGDKKLVKVTESSIWCNVKSFIKLFDITCDDVIYFGTSLSFDPCYVELFLALSTGSCLIATTKELRKNPSKLLRILFHKHKVTFMQMCPSVFTQFTSSEINVILFESTLKTLCLGGEQFPTLIIPEYMPNIPKLCKLYNLYGITEISCWASVERIEIGREVGLGAPIDETTFKIETLNGFVYLPAKCDVSCEGTLHIGSKTRICFINDEVKSDNIVFRNSGDIVKLENGRLFYIGRENDVIKRFGQRISLPKMQEDIYTSIQLENVCIFHLDKIYCFIKLPKLKKLEENIQIEWKNKTIDKIRVQLLKTMAPEYIPDSFLILKEFPILEHNGKLDKSNLKELVVCEREHLSNKNKDTSKDVFQMLWCKYIGIFKTQVVETKFYKINFWDSGGTSIAALQFCNEYQHLTNCSLNRSVLDLTLKEALDFFHSNTTDEITQYDLVRRKSSNFNVLWKSDMRACVDSSPIICHISGRTLVAVGNFAQKFAVYDGITGDEIASIDFPNVIESASLYHDGYFYVPCFDGKLHCLQLTINKSSIKLQRTNTYQTGDRLKSKPVLIGNNILFGSYDGYVNCLNKGGSLFWKTFIGEPITTEIKFHNDKIYLSTLKGSFLCIKESVIMWKHKSLNAIFNPPEISVDYECVMFVDIKGNIYCVSINSGDILWTRNSNPFTTFGPMLISRNRIFLGTEEGSLKIFKFDAAFCQYVGELKDQLCKSSIVTKPVIFNLGNSNYLLAVNSLGCIQLYSDNFEDNSGCEKEGDKEYFRLQDVYFLPNECFSSPQIFTFNSDVNYKICLGCRDNNLYCLELKI